MNKFNSSMRLIMNKSEVIRERQGEIFQQISELHGLILELEDDIEESTLLCMAGSALHIKNQAHNIYIKYMHKQKIYEMGIRIN